MTSVSGVTVRERRVSRHVDTVGFVPRDPFPLLEVGVEFHLVHGWFFGAGEREDGGYLGGGEVGDAKVADAGGGQAGHRGPGLAVLRETGLVGEGGRGEGKTNIEVVDFVAAGGVGRDGPVHEVEV